jgi:hopene-associated glycosyltransferase HpnB
VYLEEALAPTPVITLVLTIAGSAAVLIWLYLLFARGGFWRVASQFAPPPTRPADRHGPRGGEEIASRETTGCGIVVIVPARNEAEVVGQSITSLLQNCGDQRVQIFLTDDGSTDRTSDVARAAAANSGAADGLTVIEGHPPPSGWLGKPWAMQQAIDHAGKLQPRFFLLTDADIVHAPEDLTRLVSLAESGDYGLASLMVRLQCQSLAEKLLIPAFVFFFFMLYPPRWTVDPKRASAAAAGGCMLIRPEALARAGTIEVIRGQVIDDCALARAVKRSGGKIWLGLAKASSSLRQYRTFREMGRMISRTAFNQLQHSFLMLLLTVVGMSIIYVSPIILLLSGRTTSLALGFGGWMLMAIAYLPMVKYYGLNPFWALTLPASALFYVGATVYSAVNYWSGRGGEWKGRVQDPDQTAV